MSKPFQITMAIPAFFPFEEEIPPPRSTVMEHKPFAWTFGVSLKGASLDILDAI
jgi:hypothetical protein